MLVVLWTSCSDVHYKRTLNIPCSPFIGMRIGFLFPHQSGREDATDAKVVDVNYNVDDGELTVQLESDFAHIERVVQQPGWILVTYG